MYTFELTEKDHLREKTAEHLRKVYEDLKELAVQYA